MKLLLRSIVFVVVTSITPWATAQTDWTGNAGDSRFETSGNWDNGLPGAGKSAFIDQAATITINSNPSIQGLTINGTQFIGTDSDAAASVTITASSGDTLTILGGTPGVDSQDVLIDNGSTLNYSGNLTFNDGIFIVGQSPAASTGAVSGTMTLSGGTLTYDVQTTGDDTQLDVGHGIGAVGVLTQGVNSNVITGNNLSIGGDGGTGSYNLTNNSTLSTGTKLGTADGSYFIGIGYNQYGTGDDTPQASVGTLTISDSSTLTVGPGAELSVGTAIGTITPVVPPPPPPAGFTGGNGTITQNGANSTVNLEAGSFTEIGGFNAGVGNYNLSAGTLNIGGEFDLGNDANSTGTLTQTGGTINATAASAIFFGFNGMGTYDLSAGTATMLDGFNVGGVGTTGGGFVDQSGGTLVTGAVGVVNSGVAIGGPTTNTTPGTFTLSGGTSTFNGGILMGANGTFNQSGSSTSTIALSETLDLSLAGGAYNLNGGTLQVGNDGTTNGLVGASGDGTLNFGGGTLQVLTGSTATLTDALDGTVTGISTLDTTNGDITLSGILSGDGTLNVIGGNTVTFTTSDDSSASWGLDIMNGTVSADAALFPSSGAITINSGGSGATGVLNLAVNGNDTLTGNIMSSGTVGSGAFNITFGSAADSLELTGTTNFNGTTTLAGGGNLELANGTLGNINGDNSSVTIGGAAASGLVTLSGNNQYTGLTTVNTNYGLVTTNLAGGLDNSGTVATGFTPSTLPSPQATTLAIGGNFVNEATGTIVVNTNGTTTDLYTIAGTADVSNSTIKITGVGTITDHVILTSTGLTANNFTTSVAGAHVLFNGSVTQVNNTLELTTIQLGTDAFAQTRNEHAVAQAIDPILTGVTIVPGFTNLGTTLNNLTAAQIPGALDQLSPEVLQYARPIAYEKTTFLAQRMDGVDANLRAGYAGLDTSGLNAVNPGFDSSLGRSLGSLLAYNSPPFHDSAPNGVNYYPGAEGDAASPSTPAPTWDSATQTISDSPSSQMVSSSPSSPNSSLKLPAFSEFISGDIILADLNKDQSANNAAPNKASYTSGNATAGVSFRMTSNLSAGVLFDYNHTDAKTDDNGSKTKVDTYSPGLYATYANHGFYANGLFAFGYSQYSNTRNVSLLGQTATSSPNGTQYVTNLDAGYDFHPFRNWTVGPSLGLTYTHVNIDAIQETGAPGANLSINSQDNGDDLRSEFGGHVMYQTQAGPILLTPNLSVLWQHEYLNLDGNSMTSHFSDFGSSSFTTATAAPSKDSALIGCGLTATLNNSMSLYLNYIADVGATDYFAQSVVGGFKARF